MKKSNKMLWQPFKVRLMENYWKDGTGSAGTPCICEQCGSKSSRSTVPPKHVLLYWEEVSPKQRDARQQPLQGMHIANVDCRRTLATGHRLATAAPPSSSVFLAAAYVLPSSTHTGRRRAVSRSLVAAHAREAAGARRERRQDAEHGPDYRQSCSDLDGN